MNYFCLSRGQVLKAFAALRPKLPLSFPLSFIKVISGADLGGRVQGVRTPPPQDDLRFSNTTGILQKKKVVYWFSSRARDECTPS